MKGVFKTKEVINGFIQPLTILASLVGDSGVVLNVKKEDDSVNAYINAINQSIGVVIKSKYKEIFDDFTFDSDDGCKIGILKISEFISLFKIFNDTDELSFEFDETTYEMKIGEGKDKVIYKTADPSVIKEFNKDPKNAEWYTTFVYDERFARFNKAISVLKEEKCIFINGDSEKDKIDIKIKNKDIAINSFSIQIDNEVDENFEAAFTKDVVQTILLTSHDTIKMSVGVFCMIETEDTYNDSVYYISKLNKVN